jgi:hypothetical protein
MFQAMVDCAVQEFVNLLDTPDAALRPLAVLTANEQLGRIDQSMIGISILSPDQPPVQSFILNSDVEE